MKMLRFGICIILFNIPWRKVLYLFPAKIKLHILSCLKTAACMFISLFCLCLYRLRVADLAVSVHDKK